MKKKISLLLITYNHEAFIQQCISSILRQSSLHELEIIWHDDRSTDRTIELGEAMLVGKEVQVKRLFRPFNRVQRRVPFLLDMLEQVEGEYLALLEGDDFWMDDNKLMLQMMGLDKHRDMDLCFARAPIVDLDGNHTNTFMSALGDKARRVEASEVIRGDGGFIHTGSIVMRTNVFDNAPRWVFEHQPVGDYMYQVLGALRGGALYLPFDFSCWRSQNPQSFTGKYDGNIEFNMRFEAEFLGLLRRMQMTLDQRFAADFDHMIFNHLVILLRKVVPGAHYEHLVKAAANLNYPD